MKTVVALLTLCPAVLGAQWLDPDRCATCLDKQLHVAAGAAIDVALRGPWVARSWHDTAVKRVALTCAIGAMHEVVQMVEAVAERRSGPGYGFSPLDLAADCAGAVGMELLWAGARRLF